MFINTTELSPNTTLSNFTWVAVGICQHLDPCDIMQSNKTENYNNDCRPKTMPFFT